MKRIVLLLVLLIASTLLFAGEPVKGIGQEFPREYRSPSVRSVSITSDLRMHPSSWDTLPDRISCSGRAADTTSRNHS